MAAAVCLALLAAGCGSGGSKAITGSTSQISQLTAVTATTAAVTGSTRAGAGVTTTTAKPSIRVMPLGDSLTAGGDPTKPTSSPQSYRGYLYSALKSAGYDVDFVGTQQSLPIGGTDPDHEGHGGFTIGPDTSVLCTGCPPANLDNGLAGYLQKANPDVVLLMIGVNDLLPENKGAGVVRTTVPAEAGPKLTTFVGRIRSLAPKATVVVASYPPVSFFVDPALNNRAAFDTLNGAAKALGSSGDDHIVYAPMFETLTDHWTATEVLPGDALHPSAAGAERIAEVWLAALKPVLDQRR